MIATVSGDEFRFPIAFETGAGNYVEGSVSAVAVFGRLAAALNFDDVDIFGIELGANVCRDVCVGDGNAVHEPGNLVAAADVKLVVDHVGAGCVAGHEVEAIGASGARELCNFRASDGGGRS